MKKEIYNVFLLKRLRPYIAWWDCLKKIYPCSGRNFSVYSPHQISALLRRTSCFVTLTNDILYFFCYLHGTDVQQLPGSFSPIRHQSYYPQSRPAQRPGADVDSTGWLDSELTQLPEVPSHSPNKSGTSATREKTRPLLSS